MKTHEIIVAQISNGNVQNISRHNVTTAKGASKLKKNGCQLWMTQETAESLGADVETFWGTLPNGTEIHIKNKEVMENS